MSKLAINGSVRTIELNQELLLVLERLKERINQEQARILRGLREKLREAKRRFQTLIVSFLAEKDSRSMRLIQDNFLCRVRGIHLVLS